MDLGSPEFWQQLRDNPSLLAATVCSVDVVNLDETLQHHASLRAWVGATYEMAEIEEERAKWELTKARALAMMKAKETPDEKTQKAKILDVLKAEVEMDEQVMACMEAYLSAGEKKAALRGMIRGLEDRKDMLVQIAAKQRLEQKNY